MLNLDKKIKDWEETQPKEWFRVKPNVEYSKHFDFFLRNQIGVAKSNNRYTFYSKLESKHFFTKNIVFESGSNYSLSNTEIVNVCKTIHEEILDGKHGIGEFVN